MPDAARRDNWTDLMECGGAAMAFSRTLGFVVLLHHWRVLLGFSFRTQSQPSSAPISASRRRMAKNNSLQDWLKAPFNECLRLWSSSVKSNRFRCFWTGSDRLVVHTSYKATYKGGDGTQEIASEL